MATEEGFSSSSPIVGHKYDVYLSFRGVDTRHTFTDHLHNALVKANITTYLDEEEIETGEDLKSRLLNEIKASKIFLIILSKTYANSSWCLEKLALILEQRRTSNNIVIPIFYHVEPTDIRRQQGSFGDGMAKHKRRMLEESDADKRSQLTQRIDLWTDALIKVTDIMGLMAYGRRDSELIQSIVEDVNRKLTISSTSPQPLYLRFNQEMPEIPLQAIKDCTQEGISSSSPIVGHIYDVYLSYRGIDTGLNFTDQLHNALVNANITTGLDSEAFESGEDIKPAQLSAIKSSKLFLIILSENYAISSWCLDELTMILEQCHALNRIAIPIFYHVKPTDVRKQKGSFGDAIAEHKQMIEEESDADRRSRLADKIDRWTQALKEVSDIPGLDAKNRPKSELIQNIVAEVSGRLIISSAPISEMKQPKHPEIPFHAIQICTQNFNERNVIGKGGYGKVYKGTLTWRNHVDKQVAVKRLYVTRDQGFKGFNTELTMLSKYKHKNIVTLIGFCDINKEMILVYEYARHGSLDTHLKNPSAGLSWPQLFKICIDIASAVDYLHNHVAEGYRIIHRDIKSANILLDKNWNAKLADFGLAKTGLANQEDTRVITNPAGTFPYTDPQYIRTGFLTKESDVYSFGVVLFEVLCGRLAYVKYDDKYLNQYAPTCYKNGMLDMIIEPRIREDIKPRTLIKFSDIAYRCLQETREERPKIAEVLLQLKEAMKIQELEDEIL